MSQQELIGTVAIVGFPNVGKSTLVNRLTGTRAAVVHEQPGVTRDRKELICEWRDKRFRLIDTGGVDIAGEDSITRSIADQAREAVAEADVVLFVVDAQIGITPGDEEVAQILRESHKPVLVIANKIDDPRQEALALELHRLGLGDPIPISGLHGHGTGDLLDEIVDYLGAHGQRGGPELPEDAIRVAILGRPNVGKSSLVNKLLGRERVIVSEIPGTTRDSIDTVLERGDRTFVLVDTAGLRRKRRHRQGIEYYSELRALEAAERADVALVLIDASEGVVDQDLAVADIARKAGCATLVVLSKWDVSEVGIEDVRGQLRRRLRQRPAFIAVSAKTGRGLERLLDTVAELFDRYNTRVPTPELNRALEDLRERRQPPSRNGRRLNLLYAAQIHVRPPRFRIFVNDPGVVAGLPGDAPVLSLTKGLDPATGERLSTRVQGRPVAVLSGPNMAEEIAVEMPTAAVIASEDGYLAGQLQHAINSTVFRAYVNQDVVGVELCAAAKNVIALAAGAVDGLDLGDNAKASLITRGLAEMARLGEACGARPETFAGLAGMGDLIVTCWSRHGRNRHAGELIAQGLGPDEAAARIGQTVEGLTTAPVLLELSRRLGVELPITEGVCAVLSGQSLTDLVARLMGRQPTEE